MPISAVMLGVYLLLCVILAIVGRRMRIGWIGVFLLSVLFTPLAVGIILALARPMPKT